MKLTHSTIRILLYVLTGAMIGLLPAALHAQEEDTDSADAPDIFQVHGGIGMFLSNEIIPPLRYLQIVESGDPTAIIGYNIYRKEAGLDWQKLTSSPVKMKDKEAFTTAFGADFFEVVVRDSILPVVNQMSRQSIVFSNLPAEEKVWRVLSATTNPEDLGFLMLAPEILQITGMLYTDTTAQPGVEYTYSIRPVSLQGEQQGRETGSIIYSQLPIIPSSLISVGADYYHGDAKVTVHFFPREEMKSIIVLRVEEGKEPLFVGQMNTNPPSASSPRDSIVIVDTSLVEGAIVRYRAYGADIWGNRSEPKESNDLFVFDVYEDYYVTNATFTLIGDEAIEVSWAEDKKSPYYKAMIIYKARDFEGTYQPQDTVPFDAFSWRDSDVFPEELYYYRLQRVYINGDTSSISPYFTKQFEVLVPPPPPENVSAVATPEGIEVSWEPPTYKHPMLGYYLYRSVDGGENFFLQKTLDSSFRSWRDTSSNLYPYAEVQYFVEPINLSRVVGHHSDTIATLPYLDAIQQKASGLWGAAVDGDNYVSVHISDYSQVYPHIVGWNIYRSDADGSNIEKITPEPVSETVFQDKTAFPEQQYLYYHTIIDSRGFESELSEPYPLEYKPLEIIYPNVRYVGVEYQADAVILSWQETEHKDFTKYIVLRSERDGPYREIATTGESRYTDRIKRNVVYRYKVAAVFGAEITEPSAEVTVLR